MAGQPKAPFYIVLFLVVAGLIGFAYYRYEKRAGVQPVAQDNAPKFNPPANNPPAQSGTPADAGPKASGEQVEQPSDEGITTVKEYTELAPAAERLPKPKGTSSYKFTDNTVKFALNVWAGWGPILLANEGSRARKVWTTPDGEEFKVQLMLLDDPIAMRDAYVNGDVHIGWGTLDMVPLFMEGFVDEQGKPVDTRVMPRIFQQIDWSNGGDGIVVRESIKSVADLRGKRIGLARNSPSHYFALNMLVAGGMQPGDVKMSFYKTAFEAARAFYQEQDMAGAVSWSPDIYNLAKRRGNRMLVTTKTANKLITDTWFSRADFATDHPGIIEALVRGIFDGMEALRESDANKQQCAELMADFYKIPSSDTLGMLGDAHNTNWAENYQFFVNQNNPSNFERIWNQAYYLYRQAGSISNPPVPFEQVMDDSIIRKLGKEDKYASQKDQYRVQFAPQAAATVKAESDEVVTKTVVIHFFPNSWDLDKKITREVEGKQVEEAYDPNVKNVLKDIADLAGQFGAARIVIEGHTDASMKGQVDDGLVKELSRNRADAVKQALVEKNNLDPNQFSVEGVGWDRPADPSDPNNNAKNRRVEIRVYSAERPEA